MKTLTLTWIFPLVCAFTWGQYDEHQDEELAKKYKLFPNASVRYRVHFTNYRPEDAKTLTSAIKILESHTCLSFEEISTEGHHVNPFALVIKFTDLGEQDRELKFQPPKYEWPYGSAVVYLNPNQPINIILARLLNAIAGLRYEHQRSDRDLYVKINSGNILEGFENEFSKLHGYPPNISEFKSYSYNSIMNVGSYYKSKNGNPTIEPLYSQFTDYSFNMKPDMQRVNAIYSQLIYQSCFRGVLCEIKGPVHCTENKTGEI